MYMELYVHKLTKKYIKFVLQADALVKTRNSWTDSKVGDTPSLLCLLMSSALGITDLWVYHAMEYR